MLSCKLAQLNIRFSTEKKSLCLLVVIYIYWNECGKLFLECTTQLIEFCSFFFLSLLCFSKPNLMVKLERLNSRVFAMFGFYYSCFFLSSFARYSFCLAKLQRSSFGSKWNKQCILRRNWCTGRKKKRLQINCFMFCKSFAQKGPLSYWNTQQTLCNFGLLFSPRWTWFDWKAHFNGEEKKVWGYSATCFVNKHSEE